MGKTRDVFFLDFLSILIFHDMLLLKKNNTFLEFYELIFFLFSQDMSQMGQYILTRQSLMPALLILMPNWYQRLLEIRRLFKREKVQE